ncbi:hypothetical protein SNE40_022358 [Patella caerulea]|uniref:Uncharacterized protein n=1 Tax=Patella caerulea TaxID=87958 RepID=A0AAN8G3V0_PATCE
MGDAGIQINQGVLYPVIMSTATTTTTTTTPSAPRQNGNQNNTVEARSQREVEMADSGRKAEEQTGTIGLMDGKKNYKRQPQKPQKSRSCSSSRLWIFFTVLFFLTTVGILAAFIWRHTLYEECADGNETQVYQKYRGFFRTPEEQQKFALKEYERQTNESIIANETVYNNASCNISCRKGLNTEYPTRQSDPTPSFQTSGVTLGPISFNGCCQSQTYFQSPDTAEGIDGQIKVLAVDGNRRQFFRTEACKHAVGCTGCTCTRIMESFTALIVNTDVDDDDENRFEITAIKLLGCCKCLNTGFSRRR